MKIVVVLAGGGRPAATSPPGATVIAADGGAELAPALGLRVDLAVGDYWRRRAASRSAGGNANPPNSTQPHAAEVPPARIELAHAV